VIAAASLVARADCQSWSVPFNHNQPHPPVGMPNSNGNFTSPYSPWHQLPGSTAPPPIWIGVAPGTVPPQVTFTGGAVFVPGYGWPQPATPGGTCFNAIHMSVIPKGPYRGMVLVFDRTDIVAAKNPPIPGIADPAPFHVQAYQAYAIIDPADSPLGNIRYRNFVVPIGSEYVPGGALIGKTLFCSGHAWTPFGDLVVSGGTDSQNGTPPFVGGMLTYVFNPREACIWPASGSIEYYPSPGGAIPTPSSSDYFGMWVKAPDLALRRWYPTVTLTHRLNRGTPSTAQTERMLVLGGVEEADPTHPNDRAQVTYEAYAILGESAPLTSNLEPDVAVGFPPHLPSPVPATYPAVPANRVFDGPGYNFVLQAFDMRLGEYPRTFWLSTGEGFVCGYEPRSARLDHESPGTWPLTADQPGFPGVYSSNWPLDRHDGSAVLFPNLGGNPDVVLRLGGADGFAGPTTDTVETIAADGVANTWVAAAPVPSELPSLPDGGRAFANLVILPTGDLLTVGGRWQDGAGGYAKLMAPMLFSGGQWSKMPPNPVSSERTYHSTAVLLPDGRVFLGGGESRAWDYEIFSPPYLNSPVVRPVNLTWQVSVPAFDPLMGADELHYGTVYEIHCDRLPAGHAVAKAVLTAPCSVTHHSDMHQRYVELDAGVRRGNEVKLTLPADERAAPRGIYMLWLITNTGTPSEAKWVVLR
jgi:hypothetical protein